MHHEQRHEAGHKNYDYAPKLASSLSDMLALLGPNYHHCPWAYNQELTNKPEIVSS